MVGNFQKFSIPEISKKIPLQLYRPHSEVLASFVQFDDPACALMPN